MSWVRLDDKVRGHRKILKIGLEAFGFWVASLSYAADYQTDGVIPDEALTAIFPAGLSRKRCEALAAKLVEVGLWEPIEDGWQIHDYLAFNPSKADLDAEREATAHRVRAWREKRRGNAVTETKRNDDVTPLQGDGVTEGVTLPPSHPVPIPSPSPSLRSGETRAPRRKALRPWPEEFTLTDARRQIAVTYGLDPEATFEDFHDKAIAREYRYADWDAAWRTWCRNQPKYRPSGPSSTGRLPPLTEPEMADIVKREFGFAEGVKPTWRFAPRAVWEYARQAAKAGADRGAIAKILNERIDAGWDWRTYRHSVR